MAEKKYYWLKFQRDFFTSKRIKKLRTLAGGDTFTIIYLKMQLKALDTGGVIEYTGIEPTFAEEVALDIDEGSENVGITINYLLSCGLMEMVDNNHIFLPYVGENTGSETKWAEKKRTYRQGLSASTERCIDDNNRTLRGHCPIEKDKDKEKEKESLKRFSPPSVDEVSAYCLERRNGINPQEFVDFYSSKGWMIGKNKMKDWKAAVRTWENIRKKDNGRNGVSHGTDYNALVIEEFFGEQNG